MLIVVKRGVFVIISKPVVCLNDETADDDKTGEIEQCGKVDNQGLS